MSGYFCYAKHLGVLVGHSFEKESMKEPREDIARFNAFYKDRTCQKYVLEAIKNYTKCLTLDSKHVYQALPRLLSLWFDFVSTQAPGNGPHSYSKHRIGKINPCRSHLSFHHAPLPHSLLLQRAWK